MLTAALLGPVPPEGGPEAFEAALDRAREAAAQHRYGNVIEMLTPFSGSADPEIRYTATAEVGRAWYHLGAYPAANQAFREAVAIHPDRVETAIYLLATSHIVGDEEQARLVLGALLESGARDLYLAVTLAGKTSFLADPEMRKIIERHAIPLEVRAESGTVMDVSLGDTREQVLATLGVAPENRSARSLTAEAGPAMTWAFLFDPEQRLNEIVLHIQNLLEYTPYRPRFGGGVDWSSSPAAVIAAWGAPPQAVPERENSISMSWDFPGHRLTVEFARPGAYPPPDHSAGAAVMRTVRLQAQPARSPARIER
jgi:tetratricopeptide (TPR) repeat protein